MDSLFERLVMGKMPTQKEIETALYEICDDVHGSCGPECPIFALENGRPGQDKLWEENRGCDCFKNGKAMYDFIKNNATNQKATEKIKEHRHIYDEFPGPSMCFDCEYCSCKLECPGRG